MTILAETECHRLIREEKWDELVNRLNTPGGIEDAKRTLKKEDIPKDDPDWKDKLPPTSQPDSIYHCSNVSKAPIYVIRAMSKANPKGWMTPCVIGTNKDGNPIEERPIFCSLRNNISQENLGYILGFDLARQHYLGCRTYFPLHEACKRKHNGAVQALVAAFPEAALYGADSKFGLPFFIGIRNQLNPEPLTSLLDAYPDAATLKIRNDCFALHLVSEMNTGSPIFERILDCNPSACAAKDTNGQLPLHRAMNPHQNVIVDGTEQKYVVQLLLDEYPDGAKVQDKHGKLPLHLLCARGFKNKMQLLILVELLKIYPGGASVKDDEGKLPIQILVDCWSYDGFEEDAFIQLTRSYPRGLLAKHDTGNAFIKICKKFMLSTKIYRNVAIHCPLAFCSTDSDGLSSLSWEYSDDDEDPSPIQIYVLDKTVECLRNIYNVSSKTPVSDKMSRTKKIIYCGYLYSSPVELPLSFSIQREYKNNEKEFNSCGYLDPQVLSELDSWGNNTFHIACSAPCPTENKTRRYRSMVEALITWTPAEVLDCVVTQRNERGETPLHLLLKNSKACRGCLFEDIQTLSTVGNGEAAHVWDPITKLCPFMSAAVVCDEGGDAAVLDDGGKAVKSDERRDAAVSISSTYHLLQMFLTRQTLGSLREMDPGQN